MILMLLTLFGGQTMALSQIDARNTPVNDTDPTGLRSTLGESLLVLAAFEAASTTLDVAQAVNVVASDCSSAADITNALGAVALGVIAPGTGTAYTKAADGAVDGVRAVAGNKAPNFTFRGDTRSPSTIFDKGFSARGESTDLFLHAVNNTSLPSVFIPTSRSFDVASGFADNVFVIRPRNGIDVNSVLCPRSPFPHELEIAIPNRIAPSDIRGVTVPSEGISILNPNFKF